ncbi:hypothetical protein HanIR_Chr17g0873161 [Helianthus annuus]|nr:hypothetical protein HanIR_Chr17g0873161 [Helianthus annuus]
MLNQFWPVFDGAEDRWTWCKDDLGVLNLKKCFRIHHTTQPSHSFAWNNWVPKRWESSLGGRTRIGSQLQSGWCEETFQFKISFVFLVETTMRHPNNYCIFWTIVAQWCGLTSFFVFDLKDLLSFKNYYHGSIKRKKKAFYAIILIGLGCIWNTRNDCLFNHKQASVAKVVEDTLWGIFGFKVDLRRRLSLGRTEVV